MSWLAVAFGAIVGVSLGLTGGGGSIFAVPLLVFGLAVAPDDAVGISLIVVGLVALSGVLRRLRGNVVEFKAAMLMALGGVTVAPFGSWVSRYLQPNVLLGGFAVLMTIVAVLMWRAARQPLKATEIPAPIANDEAVSGAACRFDPRGRLAITSRCALGLVGIGAMTGFLSGLFGVGGGFLIVPALIFATGMGIHRAVSTSLLVIVLISLSGSIAYLLHTPHIPYRLVASFVLGGFAGLELGGRFATRVSGPRLQQGFAAAIVLVGGFVLSQTFLNS